jgi:RNA polymerase sigma-70 factor (ECF subfamily)
MNQTRPIERNTLEDLKKGDSKAFESVFRFWYEPMVNFADEYLSDLESAQNIVQNIFLRLWEKHNLVDPDSNLKSYLYMATRNACLSHIRHLKVESAYFEKSLRYSEDLQLNYEALNELNMEQLDFNRLEQLIQETIDSLPERCREVFIMSRYEDLTRALSKLRESTKEYLPELVFFLIFNTLF